MKQTLDAREVRNLTIKAAIAVAATRIIAVAFIAMAILFTRVSDGGYAAVLFCLFGVLLGMLNPKYIAKEVRNKYLGKRDGYYTEYTAL